jgi:drug/metabolite transporter (DMT)-like permease
MAALFPVVAMIGGALILDESITVNGVIGGLVVVAAVYLGALRGGGHAEIPSVVEPVPEEA